MSKESECNDKDLIKKEWANQNKKVFNDLRDMRRYRESNEEAPYVSREMQIAEAPKKRIRPYTPKPYTLNDKYKSYITRAKSKKMIFDLSLEAFLLIASGDCRYCGKNGGTLDRIDSSIGYTLSNCVPCCRTCNTMKWTLSLRFPV